MLFRKLKLIIPVASLLFTGALFGQEIRKIGSEYVSGMTYVVDVTANGKLVMRGVQGDVTVSTWDKDSLQIKEEIRMDVITREEALTIVQRMLGAYSKSGNTVTVDGRNNRRYEQHKYRISLPRKFNLNIKTRSGDITVDDLDGDIELNTSGGDIALSKIKGRINFKTSGGDIDLRNIDAPVRGRTSGGDLDLEDLRGISNLRTSGGSIRLRRAAEEVTVSTSGGDIDIEDVSADVEATTSGGSIEASNCQSRVRLKTSGGDIRLTNMGGPVRANTSGGDIDGKSFADEIDLSTSGGDIELRDVRAAVEASTSGGNIEVEITVADFKKPHGVSLTTSSGDIEVFLPAKLPAKLIAEIRLDRRSRRYNRYDIYSDFPISKQKLEDGRREVIRGEGEINGGGDIVHLVTSGGNIYIKKRGK